MTEQWRILVVEDEEQLNSNIVNSLHKDGYLIQGVRSGAEAIRMLWSDEFDVVIGDLKTPGADGFELLQWLRTYRPHTRMIMVAPAGANSQDIRTQALEAGVVSYLEKPLNLHLLKEELRRLLQQTGFSANLDSFDLLDVIQIVTMSRKSIALLVNTGLEERGTLRFQGGELIWAEYGVLHGEEAFFALAAYKNGTVSYQPWNEQISPNVTQPLSRLIFQALQYRAKYAVMQQTTGEQRVVTREAQLVGVSAAQTVAQGTTTFPALDEIDDSPIRVLVEQNEQQTDNLADPVVARIEQPDEKVMVEQPEPQTESAAPAQEAQSKPAHDGKTSPSKEWWQQTGKRPGIQNGNGHPFPGPIAKTPVLHARRGSVPDTNTPAPTNNDATAESAPREDLPSWLTEQPEKTNAAQLRPSALSTTAQVPATSVVKPHPASEWQPPASTPRPTNRQTTRPIGRITEPFAKDATSARSAVSTTDKMRRTASPEWQSPEPAQPSKTPEAAGSIQPTQPMSSVAPRSQSGPLQNSLPVGKKSGDLAHDEKSGSGEHATRHVQRPAKRNYQALVAALQTLGYSIHGFIAAAVVSMDGQPIAQVAIDDLDIAHLCQPFSMMLSGALQTLDQQRWGQYEQMVITSADRHILLHIIGEARDAFQVLITTRAADPAESLEVLQNVEGAMAAALK